jgi:hypothetical protein
MGCAISAAPQAQTGFTAALFDYYASLARSYPFERTVVDGTRAGLELGPEGLASFLEPRSIGLPAALVP